MRLENETALVRHIKEDPLCPVYLLYGRQNFLVRLYAKKLREKALPGAGDGWDFSLFEGSSAAVDEVADALQSISLFGSSRCVQLTDLDADKLSAGDFSKFKELLGSLPDSSVLIISQQNIPVDTKKSARWRNILKLVESHGASALLEGRTQRETIRFLSALCQKNGCSISPGLCEELIRRCGDDLMVLGQEVQKLCAYQQEGEITSEAVDRLCIRQLDANVFDLSRRILAKNLSAAMEILQELLDMGNEPLSILGALSAAFIDLYRCKTAREQGLGQKDVTTAFSYKGREFRVRSAMGEVDRFSRKRLADCIGLLAEADYRMKSSRITPDILLQQTVTQLFLTLHQQKEGL